jgi:hypothetical protein
MTRREALLLLAGARPLAAAALSRKDAPFLEDLSRRAFRFFWEQADTRTGLVLDRCLSDGSRVPTSRANVASIAATGFGLSALAIGATHGWVAESEAVKRTRATLRFFAKEATHEHGWFYHFLDAATGERAGNCELSSIDTALLLAGILTVRQRFKDPEISRLATAVYDRVDFPWMLNGSPTLLSHGWKPETGFLRNRWDRFNELPILYVLAIGALTRPIPPAAWYAWERTRVEYAGYSFVGAADLFTQQYPQAWIDLRRVRDAEPSSIDYFQNSVTATRAHRAFCLDLAQQFPKSYSANVWGITASDSAHGYTGWGGPPAHGPIDGTLVPSAAGGSLMFTPDISVPALTAMRERFGDRVWGRYGFCDAFNPTTGWVDSDVIGIDTGIVLLSAENLHTGNLWRWFMRNPEIPRALALAKFHRNRHSRER